MGTERAKFVDNCWVWADLIHCYKNVVGSSGSGWISMDNSVSEHEFQVIRTFGDGVAHGCSTESLMVRKSTSSPSYNVNMVQVQVHECVLRAIVFVWSFSIPTFF